MVRINPEDSTEDLVAEEPVVEPEPDVQSEHEPQPTVEEEPAASLSNIPTTPSEFKQTVKERITRAKEIGPEPIKQAAGGLVDRLFSAVDNFLDKWEKAK